MGWIFGISNQMYSRGANLPKENTPSLLIFANHYFISVSHSEATALTCKRLGGQRGLQSRKCGRNREGRWRVTCFSRVGLSVELAVLTVGIPWAVGLAWYWPQKGGADGFTGDPCVQPGLKLPAYLFVRLYNYGDNINISYMLIIANKYIGLILGPNTHLGVLACTRQGPVV